MQERAIIDKNQAAIHYLKPFVGGFRGTQEWISLAEKHQIGWWITSALESNIGLNAMHNGRICNNLMPQGLELEHCIRIILIVHYCCCYRSIVV
jgi:hypothetical protein